MSNWLCRRWITICSTTVPIDYLSTGAKFLICCPELFLWNLINFCICYHSLEYGHQKIVFVRCFSSRRTSDCSKKDSAEFDKCSCYLSQLWKICLVGERWICFVYWTTLGDRGSWKILGVLSAVLKACYVPVVCQRNGSPLEYVRRASAENVLRSPCHYEQVLWGWEN